MPTPTSEVAVDVAQGGLPKFVLVGLPHTSMRESTSWMINLVLAKN
jgi:predicted ATPase with chaperone activity